MCQAKIWIKVGNDMREIARDVTHLEVSEDQITIRSFFNPPLTIKGKISSIDFLKAKVIIESNEFPESFSR